MYKLIRVLWLLSLVGFLITFLTTYANLEEAIKLKINIEADPITIGRDSFFYLCISIFLIINVLLYVFARILRNLPAPQPNQSLWLASPALRKRLIKWLLSFAFVFNLLFIFAVILIGNMSNMYARGNITFNVWIYTTGLFFAIWMIALLFIFARRN